MFYIYYFYHQGLIQNITASQLKVLNCETMEEKCTRVGNLSNVKGSLKRIHCEDRRVDFLKSDRLTPGLFQCLLLFCLFHSCFCSCSGTSTCCMCITVCFGSTTQQTTTIRKKTKQEKKTLEPHLPSIEDLHIWNTFGHICRQQNLSADVSTPGTQPVPILPLLAVMSKPVYVQ